MTKKSKSIKSPKTASWIKAAIAEEDAQSKDQLWTNELSAEFFRKKRQDRVDFLRPQGKKDQAPIAIADRLHRCESESRCCCGVCPECGHLAQRWTTRNF